MEMWKDKILIYPKQAQLPTPLVKESCIFVYYSWRKNGLSQIGKIIFDYNFKILEDNPFQLEPGKRGSFDDSGVMPSCIFENFLFYTGWHLRKSVPYSQAIGICKINENGKLERMYDGPVMSSNQNSPCLANSPFVYKQNETINMVYCAGTHWIEDKPCYHLRKATSYSNFNFIDQETFFKTKCQNDAISRCSIHNETSYFSIKNQENNYQIYSFHKNQLNKISIEKNELDNEMQCYPYVFSFENSKEKHMLFNGNGYGSTGIFLSKC